jgi:hypothetical protein
LVIQWLPDSDSSISWQVTQDLIGPPADEVSAEREGWGKGHARLLARQGANGRWGIAGGISIMHILMLLRDMGLDPASD